MAPSDIRGGFEQIKQAFATANAPKQQLIDYSAVLGIAARIELAAGKLT